MSRFFTTIPEAGELKSRRGRRNCSDAEDDFRPLHPLISHVDVPILAPTDIISEPWAWRVLRRGDLPALRVGKSPIAGDETIPV